MIGPVETAFKAKLAELVTDWPIRWPNENWPESVPLTRGAMPKNPDGSPAPFVEAEVIGGGDSATAGPPGIARGERTGLLRIYLSVAQGTGTAAIAARTDELVRALKRRTIFADPLQGQRLTCMDIRVDDGEAATEEANRFVRMLSVYWIFNYR